MNLDWPARLACLFVVLLLTGCTKSAPPPAAGPTSFPEYATILIRDAEAAGGSDAQLAILESALATGAVSFEDASAANEATIACLVDAGFTATSRPQETVPGWIVPGYVAGRPGGMSSAQADQIVSACEDRESFYVNLMYQVQPAAEEAKWAALDDARPVVLECLAQAGIEMDDDASTQEVMMRAVDLFAGDPTGLSVNCLDEAGINSF